MLSAIVTDYEDLAGDFWRRREAAVASESAGSG
jgi:hypothetical protein